MTAKYMAEYVLTLDVQVVLLTGPQRAGGKLGALCLQDELPGWEVRNWRHCGLHWQAIEESILPAKRLILHHPSLVHLALPMADAGIFVCHMYRPIDEIHRSQVLCGWDKERFERQLLQSHNIPCEGTSAEAKQDWLSIFPRLTYSYLDSSPRWVPKSERQGWNIYQTSKEQA